LPRYPGWRQRRTDAAGHHTHRYYVLAKFANSPPQVALEEAGTLRAGALLGLNEFEAKEALEHSLQREPGL
jgi:hypothetical protein